MKKTISATIFLLAALSHQSAFAAGLQVIPAKLDFEGTTNEPMKREITVINPTADVQIFEVYADDFYENIKANPASFTLEAGSKKIIQITFDPKTRLKIEGYMATNLSIIGKPLVESRFTVETGVKIPVKIQIDAKQTSQNFLNQKKLVAAIILILFLGLAFYTRRKKSV